MQEYKIVGITEAREFLMNDIKVNRFLTYIGLFTNEIKNYLMANGLLLHKNYSVGTLFPNKNANILSTKIAGKHYKITYGEGGGDLLRKRRSYPGMYIYYNGNFFDDEFSGYPRIIFEVLDSSVRGCPVNVLSKTVERGSARVKDFYNIIASSERIYRHVRRLSNLGFLLFDDKIITPTEISRKILSSEVKKVWEKLKKWKYRIDIWT